METAGTGVAGRGVRTDSVSVFEVLFIAKNQVSQIYPRAVLRPWRTDGTVIHASDKGIGKTILCKTPIRVLAAGRFGGPATATRTS